MEWARPKIRSYVDLSFVWLNTNGDKKVTQQGDVYENLCFPSARTNKVPTSKPFSRFRAFDQYLYAFRSLDVVEGLLRILELHL